MRQVVVFFLILAGILVSPADAGEQGAAAHNAQPTGGPARITIDYPSDGSIFPPEFPPPTFLWHDDDAASKEWSIDVAFGDATRAIHFKARGERMSIGEIDRRCVAPTNELPRLTPEQASAHTWTPDADIWSAIKKHSVGYPATVTISGYPAGGDSRAVSHGRVTVQTSKDPVGAPIFYRDVPLMPTEENNGVIKPLDSSAIPLIAWRLRSVGEPRSRLMMEGLHTCANCHSFSLDGKTLGIDVDGPANDKGLYAMVDVKPHTSIRNEDVITRM